MTEQELVLTSIVNYLFEDLAVQVATTNKYTQTNIDHIVQEISKKCTQTPEQVEKLLRLHLSHISPRKSYESIIDYHTSLRDSYLSTSSAGELVSRILQC